MTSLFAPEICRTLIIQAFDTESRPAYGQVATVDEKKHPHVRTVHLHYSPEKEAIIFNTHLKSSKWKHLQKNPILSGCYYDQYREIQFRWSSKVELLDDHKKENIPLLEKMWLRMREEVRRAYWLDAKKIPLDQKLPQDINLQKRPSTHGIIVCHPTLWNIYETNPQDYCKSTSTIHALKKGQWQSKVVSILYGS
ncbi:MAG: pyridoxamine 5'-phosphate oxidase family protein [Deltaproteobacteria bacterium]|nr:pyridoxamine 5'-phosphate oxidase family protein [Deltaproteobacteria bacterium]